MPPVGYRRRATMLISAPPIAAVLIALCLWPASAGMAVAAELVMFEAKGCAVCAKFNREVGPDYHASGAARTFPLRRIDLNAEKPDFVLEMPVAMTPTFIFVDNGAERARFVGYPGRKVFYEIMEKAVEAFTGTPPEKAN